MKKSVIFDLDGTLLDTVEDLGHATNHALKGCGFPERPVPDYYRLAGRGIMNMFRGAVPDGRADEETLARIKGLFLAWYDVHMCDRTHPYPDIPELLRTLMARGIHISLASNKYQAGAEKIVTHFFPDILFDPVLGQRDGFPIKPDPAIVDRCITAAGVTKDEVLYVGDSDVDMQTGLNAGVDTVGVTWGFRSRAELETFHPFAIVDTASDLARLIL